jgi:hypothetical protein
MSLSLSTTNECAKIHGAWYEDYHWDIQRRYHRTHGHKYAALRQLDSRCRQMCNGSCLLNHSYPAAQLQSPCSLPIRIRAAIGVTSSSHFHFKKKRIFFLDEVSWERQILAVAILLVFISTGDGLMSIRKENALLRRR